MIAADRWQKSNAGKRDNKFMACNMSVGRRVVRGADWPEGSKDDGQPPRPGTVVSKRAGLVTVLWDCGRFRTYAMGHELELLPGHDYAVSITFSCDTVRKTIRS